MYLTTHQARTLSAARRVLEAVTMQAGQEGLKAGVSANAALHAGRLAEAADLAQDAVFNTLNTAANMCGSPEAQHAIVTYRS
jgi:hypothetical protein